MKGGFIRSKVEKGTNDALKERKSKNISEKITQSIIEYGNKNNEIQNVKSELNRKNIIVNILIIIIILLLINIIILCFRVGKIGFNYLSLGPETAKTITVKQEDINVTLNTELNIFNNKKFDGRKIIAPMSSGKSKFSIRNDTNEDIIFHLQFLDETNTFINMKYKMKMNNVYIRWK